MFIEQANSAIAIQPSAGFDTFYRVSAAHNSAHIFYSSRSKFLFEIEICEFEWELIHSNENRIFVIHFGIFQDSKRMNESKRLSIFQTGFKFITKWITINIFNAFTNDFHWFSTNLMEFHWFPVFWLKNPNVHLLKQFFFRQIHDSKWYIYLWWLLESICIY